MPIKEYDYDGYYRVVFTNIPGGPDKLVQFVELEDKHGKNVGNAPWVSDYGDMGVLIIPNPPGYAELIAAVRKAEQLASIATDWNLTEVEIDGVMVPTYELRQWFGAVLALVNGE